MKLLGAILAGGGARRFGSDKARAEWQGKPLIEWVAAAMRAQCALVVLCGREAPGFVCLPDIPHEDLGPLGGLNAALSCAAQHGFTHVLSAGVDAPNLPFALRDTLEGEGAAIVESQPVIGLWPSSIQGELTSYLSAGERALYGFASRIGARRITLDTPLMNVNRPDDLAL